jgi:hypothetical protein
LLTQIKAEGRLSATRQAPTTNKGKADVSLDNVLSIIPPGPLPSALLEVDENLLGDTGLFNARLVKDTELVCTGQTCADILGANTNALDGLLRRHAAPISQRSVVDSMVFIQTKCLKWQREWCLDQGLE